MKKKLLKIIPLVAFVALIVAPAVSAQSGVSLSWDASTTAGVSYNLYRSKTAGGCATADPACVQVNAAPITVLTFSDTPGISGRWFYVVRASDADGVESVNSNELAVILPPSPPTNLRKN